MGQSAVSPFDVSSGRRTEPVSTWHHDGVTDAPATGITVKTVWPDSINALPVLSANQFIAQVSGLSGKIDEVILTFGHAVPPVLLGDDANERLAGLDQVEVRPLARFSVSRDRIQEFAALLQTVSDALSETTIPQADQ
jgi:hypothetical protein